jgi:hypothetical protein
VVTAERTSARRELFEVEERIDPKLNRARSIERLDEIFRSGRAPDPRPDGFQYGRFITMSVWGPSDGLTRRIAHLYMPWLGKQFDAAAETGINILKPSARTPMRALWRSYEPRVLADRLEAFPFRTRVAPGAVDSDLDVLKIDYDFEANPDFIIRRILDELVQVDVGFYLGKILFRTKESWKPIGFFTLEN